MKILICGMGALGTVYGCLLKGQGHYVAGLDRPETAAVIEREGLYVNGIWGEHHAWMDEIASRATDLSEKTFDLIIVSVKAFNTGEALQAVRTLLEGPALVMLAQNGLGNYETARDYVPDSRLIVARVIFGSVTEGPGRAAVTVIADDVLLGSPAGAVPEAALEEWAEIFRRSSIPTRTSQEIMQFIWAKVIYNSALNPLGAILELPYGRLAEIEFSRQVMDNIIREIFMVMNAIGQSAPWPDADAYLRDFYGQMLPATGGHHASMLQDIRNGRKTEIEALNGAIIALGKENGLSTPYNHAVYLLLRAREQERLGKSS